MVIPLVSASLQHGDSSSALHKEACACLRTASASTDSELWSPNQLEEMGLPYKVEAIDIGTNKQKGALCFMQWGMQCAVARQCFCT
jgi:hypothetical protein